MKNQPFSHILKPNSTESFCGEAGGWIPWMHYEASKSNPLIEDHIYNRLELCGNCIKKIRRPHDEAYDGSR